MPGVDPDDLDHSLNIAEYDWTSFCEESEECSLLQPSLAGLDSLSPSDSEDSVSPAYPVIDAGQHDAQQRTASCCDIYQSNAKGLGTAGESCTDYIKLSVQVNHSGTGGQPEDRTIKAEEDGVLLRNGAARTNDLVAQGHSEICLHYPGGTTLATKAMQMEPVEQITEVTNYSIINYVLTAQRTESPNAPCSNGARDAAVSTDLKRAGGKVQRERGTINLTPIQEPDPFTCDPGERHTNRPPTTERGALCEKESGVVSRAEKERWFVTLDDGPLRQRVLPSAVRKKRRTKKPSKKVNTVCSDGPKRPLDYGSKLEINKANESVGDAAHFTQSHQDSGVHPSAELSASVQKGLPSESALMYITSSPFGENVSEKLEMSHLTKAASAEPWLDRDECEPYSSAESSEKPVNLPASPLHDTFALQGETAALFDSMESEEFEDGVENMSTHSYDSENYLSAPESAEEPRHVSKDNLTERQPVDVKQSEQRTASPTASNSPLLVLTETADVRNAQDTEKHPCDTQKENLSTIPSDVAADSESSLRDFPRQCNKPHRSDACVESTMTFPSAGQRADIMPEDNGTSDNDTHSGTPPETPEPQDHKSTAEFKLSASGFQGRDQLRSPPLSAPDLTVTPCSVADSPETHAEALGPTRPVYAISAFWDEMEKCTIKDILQLKMGRSPSPRETRDIQGTPRPHVDVTDTQTHNSSSVDAVEYLSPDGALMDTSDTADSDYFTQPDDSKPDRSSCEFSTHSDFDDEYWQFIGASRSPSPEPQNKNQQSQRTTNSPVLTRDSQEPTNPVGKEAIVAADESAGQRFDNHASHVFLSSKLARARGITKSKSMHNIQGLNTENPRRDVPVQSTLETAERSLEENIILNVSESDMLGTITPAPILSNTDILDENYKISLQEVFEYMEEPENDSRSVTVCDSEDISVDLAYNCPLSRYRPEMPLSSLQDSQIIEGKPIPIFSCSHPTVRDVTFPELDYLFFPQDMHEYSEKEADSSAIRVVSRSQIQDDSASSAAPDGLLFNKNRWSSTWKILFPIRKMCFPDKGSISCQNGTWEFPVEVERLPIKTAKPAITMFDERRVCSLPHQFFRELAVRQKILKSIKTTASLSKKEGLFSTLKQSDMCLVCIAIASWVLRSSDPQAADAWKAALLANVSAISAIQYLRQYVKKDPPQDEP